MRKILFLIILLLLVGCTPLAASPETNFRWEKANYRNFDGIVAITINGDELRCSGVMLSPTFGITAGHCITSSNMEKLSVVNGCNDVRDDTCQFTPIDSAIISPIYKTEQVWNDVAVFSTMFPVDIKPATLATSVKKDIPLILAGFGRRPNGDFGILYSGFSAVSKHRLYEFWTYENAINGPCGGDSGGPAIIWQDGQLKVLGILSRSIHYDSSNCGGVSLYTVPMMYTDWLQHMNYILNQNR